MSANALAALRRNAGNDFADLAEKHLQHDLQQEDRDKLSSAASTLSTYATIGSLAGLSLGAFLAFRVRSARTRAFQAFRAAERPTHLQFADGRLEPIPDMTALAKPSTLGDIAAYTFFGAGGLFLGGELGALTGSASATRTITKDPESRARIERAFRSFRADLLRQQAAKIESGEEHVGF